MADLEWTGDKTIHYEIRKRVGSAPDVWSRIATTSTLLEARQKCGDHKDAPLMIVEIQHECIDIIDA